MSSAAVNEKTASAIFASSVLKNAGARQNPYSKGPAARMATVTIGLKNVRANSPNSAGSLRATLISQANRAPNETMVPHTSVKPSMSRPSVGVENVELRFFHGPAGSPRLYRPRYRSRGPSPRPRARALFSRGGAFSYIARPCSPRPRAAAFSIRGRDVCHDRIVDFFCPRRVVK